MHLRSARGAVLRAAAAAFTCSPRAGAEHESIACVRGCEVDAWGGRRGQGVWIILGDAKFLCIEFRKSGLRRQNVTKWMSDEKINFYTEVTCDPANDLPTYRCTYTTVVLQFSSTLPLFFWLVSNGHGRVLMAGDSSHAFFPHKQPHYPFRLILLN
jgi:hypothetical protein